MLTTVILGATIFSLAGFINAVYAKKFDDVAIVPTFILTPLTYLGGVFYSVKLLPGWAEAATHANPIFYMVNAFRYGLLGSSDVPLPVAYGLMIGFVVALTALALWLLRRGVGMRSWGGLQGLRPCTRRINVNFNGNVKSWHSLGWRGGSDCGDAVNPSLGAWPRHPCRGHPQSAPPAFDKFRRSAGMSFCCCW